VTPRRSAGVASRRAILYKIYMSRRVSITNARKDLKALARAAQLGASIDITNRGEVVARLVPPANDLGHTADVLLRLRAGSSGRRGGASIDVSSRKNEALANRRGR
jgi:antitoxin (DNA-binding transcriptional repressor) of toxin-antitoxin stability system